VMQSYRSALQNVNFARKKRFSSTIPSAYKQEHETK